MVAVDTQSVRVYTVNGAAVGSASSLPDWLVRKRAAKAKGKRAIRERVEGTIELIQHFEFPEASNRIKTTRDGHHVIATGTYKPQMRVWDLDQLALKFERHADVENVDFIVSFISRPFLIAPPQKGKWRFSLVFSQQQRLANFVNHRIVVNTPPFIDPF